jgi:membrane protein required for colicin V production
MNWLDIVIIFIAALFGLFGLWQGAIKALFGVAGLVGGIVLAGRYYQALAAILSPSGAIWSEVAAYTLIVIATLVAAGVIGWLVSHLVHITMLGWLDRLIGFVLGAAVGCLLCAAILAIISKYFPGTQSIISQSAVARFLMEQFPLLLALLPDEFDFVRNLFH